MSFIDTNTKHEHEKLCKLSDDISVRTLSGEPDILIPLSCSDNEEKLLRAVLEGKEYQLPSLPSRLHYAPIIDVGANLGMFTTAVRRQFPEAIIYAVEPSPRNLGILSHNLKKLHNVHIYPFCLGERNERTKLHLGCADSGLADSLYDNRLSGQKQVEVDMVDAQTLFREHIDKEVAILKIDTEGHEVPILVRIKCEFHRIAAIFVEYHSEKDRRAIDALLEKTHDLYFSKASVPHRGTCGYLHRNIIAELGEGKREIHRISEG